MSSRSPLSRLRGVSRSSAFPRWSSRSASDRANALACVRRARSLPRDVGAVTRALQNLTHGETTSIRARSSPVCRSASRCQARRDRARVCAGSRIRVATADVLAVGMALPRAGHPDPRRAVPARRAPGARPNPADAVLLSFAEPEESALLAVEVVHGAPGRLTLHHDPRHRPHRAATTGTWAGAPACRTAWRSRTRTARRIPDRRGRPAVGPRRVPHRRVRSGGASGARAARRRA